MPKPIKYLNTPDVAKRTGRPYNEILELVKSGILPSHRTHSGRYRLNVDAVEAYFGIQINKAEEEKTPDDIPTEPKFSDKFICGATARKYLNCSKGKFESLVARGEIQAFRDEDKRWKVSKKSVLNYVERMKPSVVKAGASIGTRLITKNFFQEIIPLVCAAESSIKIMTADFNLFRLEPTKKQGKKYGDGTPFFDFLMEKANDGVSVEIICSEKSEYINTGIKIACHRVMSCRFNFYRCIRNHAKVVIVDNRIAYVGSANMTRAGIGQPYVSPGNFEAGILTEDPEMIASLNKQFSDITRYKFCGNCHRKKDCMEHKK